MSTSEPLIIIVETEGEYLIVTNNISRRDQHQTSTGIGLENIKKRYALVTDKKVLIEQTEKYFLVQLPLLKTTV
jgi:hypothetical protein